MNKSSNNYAGDKSSYGGYDKTVPSYPEVGYRSMSRGGSER